MHTRATAGTGNARSQSRWGGDAERRPGEENHDTRRVCLHLLPMLTLPSCNLPKIHTCARTHALTHSRTHMHSRTHAHTCTHTHTHAHTCTHTHTHALPHVCMRMQEALTLIQRHERARQGRVRAKLMQVRQTGVGGGGGVQRESVCVCARCACVCVSGRERLMLEKRPNAA